MGNAELVKTTLDALERLMKMFTIERYLYLALTCFSFLLLIYAVVQMFSNDLISTTVLVSIFGGSGLVAVSAFRVVWFFNRSFTLVEGLIERMSK
ncbi:hypothetical protein [Arsukibacterium sp.]|jgi:hypothetical protein|uniref:hypothetical protein n=1 Tax=Arsukibacterium sp. TaxID=1977258 RepID=UPI002FD959D5